MTDRWSPGWRATVNGRATPILGANNVFRAVAVEAGRKRRALHLRPWAWPWLLVTSWGLLAIAVASAGARVLLRQTGRVAVREVALLPGSGVASRVRGVDRDPRVQRRSTTSRIPLASLVEHVRQSDWDAEVIVVDDGSEDSTRAAAETEGAAGAAAGAAIPSYASFSTSETWGRGGR